MRSLLPPGALHERARGIRLLGLDIDGTLTDGRLFIGADGEAFKAFHVQDGLGMKLLARAGVEVAWITARQSRIAATRAAELGIGRLIQGCKGKREALQAIADEIGIDASAVAFMGDDLPDLSALRWCGLACGPANAHGWIRPYLHWQARAHGGDGALRELADLLIEAKGLHETLLADWLD